MDTFVRWLRGTGSTSGTCPHDSVCERTQDDGPSAGVRSRAVPGAGWPGGGDSQTDSETK